MMDVKGGETIILEKLATLGTVPFNALLVLEGILFERRIFQLMLTRILLHLLSVYVIIFTTEKDGEPNIFWYARLRKLLSEL